MPPEVIALVVNKLDCESAVNFLETCTAMLNIGSFVKPWSIARGDVRSRDIFRRPGFLALCWQLREVDLRSIQGLQPYIIKDCMNALTHVTKLDLSVTDITLKQLMTLCPQTVRHISFTLSANDLPFVEMVVYCEFASFIHFLKRFTSIHWTQKIDFRDTEPMNVLNYLVIKLPDVEDFKVIYVFKDCGVVDMDIEERIQLNRIATFKRLAINYIYYNFKVFPAMLYDYYHTDFQFYIYNFDKYNHTINIITTPDLYQFMQFDHSIFNVHPDYIYQMSFKDLFNILLSGQVICVIWNKVKFASEEVFLASAKQDILNLQPNHLCFHDTIEEIVFNKSNKLCIVHNSNQDADKDIIKNAIESIENYQSKKYSFTYCKDCFCGIARTVRLFDLDNYPSDPRTFERCYDVEIPTYFYYP